MRSGHRLLAALPLKSVAVSAVLAACVGCILPAQAQQLDAKFSCSSDREQDHQQGGDRRLYADNAEMHLRGNAIESFRWESSLFRSTHGFDCSIDDGDGLQAELLPNQAAGAQGWRVSLQDGRLARTRRGYDADHGVNCSIRIVHDGDVLRITPSCPALCGSRENFSALTVDLKTGQCSYEH